MKRAALVVAHPSHELCMFGWLQRARPCVFVLTNGSGGSGKPQLPSTVKVLSAVGATRGSMFGRLPDPFLYAAILEGNTDLFVGLADELAESFVKESIDHVVGDASEGYSPAHDICRLLINAGVEIAASRYDHP